MRDRLRIVLEAAAALQTHVPVGRVGVEALVEGVPDVLVGVAVVAALVDLEQLQVGQRALAALVDVALEQRHRRLVLAEDDEELGLLLEVDQLLHRQLAAVAKRRAAVAERLDRGARELGAEHRRHLEAADRGMLRRREQAAAAGAEARRGRRRRCGRRRAKRRCRVGVLTKGGGSGAGRDSGAGCDARPAEVDGPARAAARVCWLACASNQRARWR